MAMGSRAGVRALLVVGLAVGLTVLVFWVGVTVVLGETTAPRPQVLSGSFGPERVADYQVQLERRMAPVRP